MKNPSIISVTGANALVALLTGVASSKDVKVYNDKRKTSRRIKFSHLSKKQYSTAKKLIEDADMDEFLNVQFWVNSNPDFPSSAKREIIFHTERDFSLPVAMMQGLAKLEADKVALKNAKAAAKMAGKEKKAEKKAAKKVKKEKPFNVDDALYDLGDADAIVGLVSAETRSIASLIYDQVESYERIISAYSSKMEGLLLLIERLVKAGAVMSESDRMELDAPLHFVRKAREEAEKAKKAKAKKKSKKSK